MKIKSGLNQIFAILVIFLVISAPASFAQKPNDEDDGAVDYEDSPGYQSQSPGSIPLDEIDAEPEAEEINEFDVGALNPFEEEKKDAAFSPMSISLPTGSIAGSYGSKDVNILSKFAPDGLFKNDLFTGSASYAYSIEVPPGVNGLGPLVNLNYNSYLASSRGILGNGWGVAIDSIYRDTEHTQADPSDDTYHLQIGGMNLELVYSPSEGRYHTEFETYMDIRKEGDMWIVRAKDGTTYKFGSNENSRLLSSLYPYASIWYIYEIADTYGNKIIYEYLHNPSSDIAVYPSIIKYGINSIQFRYNFNAQNGFNGYAFGTKIRQTALLSGIEVKNGNNIVRKYAFDYEEIDNNNLLRKIRHFGKNGDSELPPVEFSYYINDRGWSEDLSWQLPSDVDLGIEKDKGVRLLDINGDGYSDIMQMQGSGAAGYWLNTKSGWAAKQQWSSPFPAGFSDTDGNDLGIRFLDINGDTRTDMWQLVSGRSQENVFAENTGSLWQAAGISAPAGASFAEKAESKSRCNPNNCPPGYAEAGMSCGSSKCTRFCSSVSCSNYGRIVRDGTAAYPQWNDNDYDEEDSGDRFTPQPSRCYKFEYTGGFGTDNDDSECYDLTTDETRYYTSRGKKRYSYSKDCDGDDLDAYAGIGFVGNGQAYSWLRTVPGSSGYGFIGDVTNSYWKNRYLSRYDIDGSPDTSGSNAGEWEDLNDAICDEAGVHTIHCAPSAENCAAWGKDRCGYGCANEATSPFVVMGVYASYSGNLDDALSDHEPACDDDVMEDNDYFGYGIFRVTEYDILPSYSNQECSYKEFEFISGGTLLADLNGDGKTDLLKGKGSERKAWIRSGDNWEEKEEWRLPEDAVFADAEGKGKGVRVADVNGDSFPDIIKADESSRRTWLNTGNGWSEDSSWSLPPDASFSSNGQGVAVLIADINSDGFADILKSDSSSGKIWLNTGNGWKENSAWKLPSGINFNSPGVLLEDVNGDGLADVIKADSASKNTWISRYQKQYMLKEMRNGFGGKISLDYRKIASLDNSGGDSTSDLGFNGWAVSEIIRDNGMAGEHKVESKHYLTYSNGLFDSGEREFRGFGYVEETRADGAKVRHHFHQDDGRKGMEFRTEILDASNNPFSAVEYEFRSNLIGGSFNLSLSSIKSYVYDGAAENPKTTLTSFDYDDYGNMIKTSYLGDISIEGDERYGYNEYYYDNEKWIMDKPSKSYLLGPDDSTKIRESYFQYNEFGDIAKVEHWLAGGNNPSALLQYDSYGNLVSEKDADGHEAKYEYDAANTFAVRVTNAKNHQFNYEYDDGTGSLLSETDPNGIKAEYTYDDFGRRVMEIKPYDSPDSPTIKYSYEFDGSSPEKVIVSRKENDAGRLDEYYYYDGFGSLLQSKSEAGGSNHIASDIYYDSNFRLKRESNPYYTDSAQYSAPSQYVGKFSYFYDAIDRKTKIVNPDKTESSFEYSRGVESVYDENGNRKDIAYDAYGSIVNVTEHNGESRYTTHYSYNAAGDLTGIRDNQGNKIAYEYDSLGRKIALDDPDLGVWAYEYDNSGNLIKQTDAMGSVVAISYDELNRPVLKSSSEGDVKYTYDSGKIEVLSSINTPQIAKSYEYDDRLRIIEEEKI
ncbi:VCBS repeat-containing protein, partial [Candidatus Woesearchaeota archaeon]|nr:VCBS repeat-containing protein [Candidatus Woesearchaeota archaeon]